MKHFLIYLSMILAPCIENKENYFDCFNYCTQSSLLSQCRFKIIWLFSSPFFLILLHPFHEALSVSNWRLRHSFITTSCPRFLRSPFPSRPCERGCIYKSSNYTLISHSVGMTKFFRKTLVIITNIRFRPVPSYLFFKL